MSLAITPPPACLGGPGETPSRPEPPARPPSQFAALEARGLIPETHWRAFHPDCAGCCARGVCHWCLEPPQDETHRPHALLEWQGFLYRACRVHLPYLVAHLRGLTSPDAVIAGSVTVRDRP